MDLIRKKILASILNLPTAPLNDHTVATFVRWYCLCLGLKIKEDRAGNILVTYGKGKPSVTFTAHMDHPGFEIISAYGKSGIAALYGKVNPKIFAGANVIVESKDESLNAKIDGQIKNKKYMGKPCFAIKARAKIFKGDFGYFDIPGIKFSGKMIHARAADDLMNVAAILDLFTRLVSSSSKYSACALFTRTEELGFFGAFAAIESKIISKDIPVVVLECSSAPGGKVDIGGGPVIRGGDLQSTYTPDIDVWMSNAARDLVHKDKKFKFQRALLQGGRCESCVYTAEGFRAGGIALALGNYHNHGPKGYAAEYISADDYENLIKFLAELIKKPVPKNILKKNIAPVWKNYRAWKKRFL